MLGKLDCLPTTNFPAKPLYEPKGGCFVQFVPDSMGLLNPGMSYAAGTISNIDDHTLFAWINEDVRPEFSFPTDFAGVIGLPTSVTIVFTFIRCFSLL